MLPLAVRPAASNSMRIDCGDGGGGATVEQGFSVKSACGCCDMAASTRIRMDSGACGVGEGDGDEDAGEDRLLLERVASTHASAADGARVLVDPVASHRCIVVGRACLLASLTLVDVDHDDDAMLSAKSRVRSTNGTSPPSLPRHWDGNSFLSHRSSVD